MSKPVAEIEITASDRRLGAQLAAAARKFKDWGAAVARGIGSTIGKVNDKLKLGDTGKHAMGNLASGAIAKGTGAILDAADGVRNFERNLVRLQITADQNSSWSERMRGEIRGISKDTGVAADEILGGAQTYVDLTGDVAGAEAAMKSFSRIAVATGSNTQDIATATAAMTDSMHVQASELESVYSGLANQGKAGAVSLKDMAQSLAELLPRFAEFKGATGAQGVLQMGAAFQVARKTFGDASQAATGLEALTKALSQHSGTLKKFANIDVFADKGHTQLKDFRTLIHEMADSKLLQNKSILGKALGERAEALATFDVLRKHLDMYDQMITAGEDRNTVERDFNTMTQSDAGRLDLAFNRMKIAVAEAFTPERINAFTQAIEGLVGKLGPVLDFVGKIGEKLGAIEKAGEWLGGKMAGEAGKGHTELSDEEKALIGETDGMTMIQSGIAGASIATMSPEQRKARTHIAQLHKRESVAHNTAVDDIMGAQGDADKVTPEAWKKAMAYKYADPNWKRGGAGMGMHEAGNDFLRNTKSKDPVEMAIEATEKLKHAFGDLKFGNQVSDAILKGFGLVVDKGMSVKIGDNQVAKSNANATDPRRKTQ